MAVSGTLGALLQGVSQQATYLRADGQVTEQINILPDVTRGLTSRPAAVMQGAFEEAGIDKWLTVELKGEQIQLGTEDGRLVARQEDGTSITVTGGSNAYIGTDHRAYVYDDQIYLVNRDRVVDFLTTTDVSSSEGLQSATVDGDLLSVGSAYATSLGGKFSVIYTLKMKYSDGSTAEGTFETPDGSDVAHAAELTASNIIAELITSIEAHGSWKGTSTSYQSGSVLRLEDTAFNFTLRGDDGDGGTTFRVADQTTNLIEDIPTTASNGAILRVVGSSSDEDDVWFRFSGTWGERGKWEETYNPQEPTDFDLSTMPHIITGDTSALTLAQGNWQGRRVGDTVTNPEPSFVGKALRDVTGFQSRIVVISGQSLVMSRTNIPVDFWNSSAAQRVVTDRIDIISTTESDYLLEWLLPFDRDLIVWGKRSQFLVSGASAITPDNASIVETTNFETDAQTRPVSTGRTVLFSFQEGGFAGVKEFFSSNSVDANEANSITKVQSRYMAGTINRMVSSTNFSLMLCTTDAAPNTIFGYQYYFDGEKKVQSAWFRMDFSYAISNMAFKGSRLNLLLKGAGGTHYQTAVDFDLPATDGVGYHVCLDFASELTATAGVGVSELIGDFDNLIFAQGTGCAVPGQTLKETAKTDNGDGTWTYEFDPTSLPTAAKAWAGFKYTRSVMPSMPLIRDQKGKPISSRKLVVGAFIIYFVDSGAITCVRSSKYRTNDVEHSNFSIPLANDPDDPLGIGIKTGEYRVRWGERSDWSELEITTDDIRPMTITEVEWEGQVLSKGNRR